MLTCIFACFAQNRDAVYVTMPGHPFTPRMITPRARADHVLHEACRGPGAYAPSLAGICTAMCFMEQMGHVPLETPSFYKEGTLILVPGLSTRKATFGTGTTGGAHGRGSVF